MWEIKSQEQNIKDKKNIFEFFYCLQVILNAKAFTKTVFYIQLRFRNSNEGKILFKKGFFFPYLISFTLHVRILEKLFFFLVIRTYLRAIGFQQCVF